MKKYGSEPLKPNTSIELKDLEIGDRFNLPGKTDVWQVTGKTTNNVLINQFAETGKLGVETCKLHLYDHLKKGSTRVIFRRRTVNSINETDELSNIIK